MTTVTEESPLMPQGPSDAGRAMILVVERDPHVRELEAYFLEKEGYSVEFAENGMEAIERVGTLRPHIVITEILVPGIDGLSVCRTIKGDDALKGISVLVFSVLAASGRAREAGADAFLLKPLAEQMLVQTVAELLERRKENAS